MFSNNHNSFDCYLLCRHSGCSAGSLSMTLLCCFRHFCSQCNTVLPNAVCLQQIWDFSWLFYIINLKLWASIWEYLGLWLRSLLHENCSKLWILCMLKSKAQTKHAKMTLIKKHYTVFLQKAKYQLNIPDHSMAIAILNKSEDIVKNTTAASKCIPWTPRISINWNLPFQTQIYLVNSKKMKNF